MDHLRANLGAARPQFPKVAALSAARATHEKGARDPPIGARMDGGNAAYSSWFATPAKVHHLQLGSGTTTIGIAADASDKIDRCPGEINRVGSTEGDPLRGYPPDVQGKSRMPTISYEPNA